MQLKSFCWNNVRYTPRERERERERQTETETETDRQTDRGRGCPLLRQTKRSHESCLNQGEVLIRYVRCPSGQDLFQELCPRRCLPASLDLSKDSNTKQRCNAKFRTHQQAIELLRAALICILACSLFERKKPNINGLFRHILSPSIIIWSLAAMYADLHGTYWW